MDTNVVLHAISGYLFMSILLASILVAIALLYNIWLSLTRDQVEPVQKCMSSENVEVPVICAGCNQFALVYSGNSSRVMTTKNTAAAETAFLCEDCSRERQKGEAHKTSSGGYVHFDDDVEPWP